MKITARLYIPITPSQPWVTAKWEFINYSTIEKVEKNATQIFAEIYSYHSRQIPISKIDLYDTKKKLFICTKTFNVHDLLAVLGSPEPSYREGNLLADIPKLVDDNIPF